MQLQSTDKVAAREAEERIYDHAPRWGRRFGVAFVLIVLLIVGGFYGWTASGRNGLARQVAIYRAAGEPIEMSDFVVHGVPDHDNAALLLREAAKFDEKADVWVKYERFSEPFALPLTDKEAAAIRDVCAANTAAFDTIDQAMTRKGVDWQIRYASPGIQILLPDLNGQRQLANLVVARARLNYQQGDHAAAIADLRRAAFIGRTVGHHPFLVGHLVHLGINALTCEALIEISPGLKIGDAPREARAADVNELVAQLLDDKPARESYRLGMYGERMAQLDTARCVADGRLSLANLSGAGVGATPNPLASVATYAAKPVALSDGRLMIDHTTSLLRAFEASPDWPTYQKTAPPFPPEVANTMVRHLLAKMMLPSFERGTLSYFRNAGTRRMTATALAARRYAADHGGKLPAKLNDLVPTYLPAVPLDPFAARAQPLKYVNDPDKPIVYSVGEDGIDGGGSELPTKQNAGGARRLTRWDKLDAVVHLKAQPRAVMPDDAAADDDEPPTTAPTIAPADAPADAP